MAGGVNRDRRREAEWQRTIQAQRQSGLSVREFCRRSKVRESGFYFWRRELERRQAEQKRPRRGARPAQASSVATAPAFVVVRVTGQEATSPANLASPSAGGRIEATSPVSPALPPAGGRIEIELPGQRRVHITVPVDRQALADVLAVLEECRGQCHLPGTAGDGQEVRPC